jgi:serine/threonine protein kinase
MGCLLYELLTGEYLFYTPDYVHFFIRVTSPNEQLLTDDKLLYLNNNIYLIDFLKYMLVRDPRHRPSISNVLKRFEHVHALLVTTSSSNNRFWGQNNSISSLRGPTGLESLLESSAAIMCPKPFSEIIQEKVIVTNRPKHAPLMMKIMEDVYLSCRSWLFANAKNALEMGVTHIVIKGNEPVPFLDERFEVLYLNVGSQSSTLNE